MDNSALGRPGEVWRGTRDHCAGRVIRIEDAGDDGYVTYKVLVPKNGVQKSKEGGRMSALSLRGAYERVPREELEPFWDGSPEGITSRVKRALRVIAGRE